MKYTAFRQVGFYYAKGTDYQLLGGQTAGHSYHIPKTLNAHIAFTLSGHSGDSAEHISNKSSKEK
jgi:hypothetical protein